MSRKCISSAMPVNQSNLSLLLQSKSLSAQILGFAICLFLFVPDVARVAGNPNLTVWQRIEQISLSLAQTLLAVGVAAIPPQSLIDEPEREDESSVQDSGSGTQP